ncbi:GNAT family N-acetyltransferase [Streptomyces uncialis]|uniref:GNAT family N-acetyltransferase n=1 Tax=Streptomyces uncialis TaxID=1048205 RepID=UPI0037A55BB9
MTPTRPGEHPVRIRHYEDRDWEAVARIHDAARLDELRDSVGVEAFLTLERTAETEGLFDGEVWVAEEPDGRVAGFVALADDEVTWLYVDPAAYRRGIGARLLRYAVERGGPRIGTTVLVGNAAALALYEREGFALVETKSGKLEGNESFAASGHIMELRK